MPINRTVLAKWCGRVSYCEGIRLQKEHIQKHFDSGSDSISNNVLLLLEHDPVYTVGIRRQEYSEKEAARLRALGAEFHRTDRGGLITFHGPGQLVVYPILNLKQIQSKPSVKNFVCKIEETIINLCAKFGVKGNRSPHTGVWVNDRKVCAIGLHVGRYISSHGLALNCDTDLGWFSHIVPCGIVGKEVTSLSKELGRNLTVLDAIQPFLESFKVAFECDVSLLEETVHNMKNVE